MPREAALPRAADWAAAVPDAWRKPLLRLAIAWSGLIGLLWREWADMAHQWWASSTYNHILLIPPILAWLVIQRAPALVRLTPCAWGPGLGLAAIALSIWAAGALSGINLVSQLGAVALMQATVAVLLGPRVAAALLFPLAYMVFLVPFGDELVPGLQAITADMAVALTHASGVPARIDGVFIDTPAGLFEVAEACSGAKFLIAMVALGALAAHLCFAGWKRRAVFMLAAVIVPILANGVRAWGTIYIAQSQGLEFAAGFDHIVYGWVFFAVVMIALLGAAWRFFDRAPDDPLVDVGALETSAVLTRLARPGMGGWPALVVLLLPAAVTVASVETFRTVAGPSAARMDRVVHLP